MTKWTLVTSKTKVRTLTIILSLKTIDIVIVRSDEPNLLFKLFNKELQHRVVKIFSAQQRVSIGRFHLKHALLYLED